jgi:hypothetical protein
LLLLRPSLHSVRSNHAQDELMRPPLAADLMMLPLAVGLLLPLLLALLLVLLAVGLLVRLSRFVLAHTLPPLQRRDG